MSLRNNKDLDDANIAADLIKHGGTNLFGIIFYLIREVWTREKIPRDWKLDTVYPIHRQKNIVCSNYRESTTELRTC